MHTLRQMYTGMSQEMSAFSEVRILAYSLLNFLLSEEILFHLPAHLLFCQGSGGGKLKVYITAAGFCIAAGGVEISAGKFFLQRKVSVGFPVNPVPNGIINVGSC